MPETMGSLVANFCSFRCRFGVLVEHFRKPRNQPAIGRDGRQQAPVTQDEIESRT
jgi:hypothetical protein